MRPLTFEERVICLGITFSGKSHFAKNVIIPQSGFNRAVIFDLRKEYPRDVPNCQSMTLAEFARFAVQNKQAMTDPDFPLCIAVHPSPRSAEDNEYQATEFRDFVRICESTLNWCVIVIEEAGQFEDNRKAQSSINYLATQSRHWHCPLVVVAQCAVQIPKITRRQAHRVYSFRQVDADDLRALSQYFGAFSQYLPRLPQGEYFGWEAAEYQLHRPSRLLPPQEESAQLSLSEKKAT